jgi:hypothetical protein
VVKRGELHGGFVVRKTFTGFEIFLWKILEAFPSGGSL